tara:strand:+ start:7369 stop:9510 length:2142 start_codon:yes stop_codon:yes gene_type:complete
MSGSLRLIIEAIFDKDKERELEQGEETLLESLLGPLLEENKQRYNIQSPMKLSNFRAILINICNNLTPENLQYLARFNQELCNIDEGMFGPDTSSVLIRNNFDAITKSECPILTAVSLAMDLAFTKNNHGYSCESNWLPYKIGEGLDESKMKIAREDCYRLHNRACGIRSYAEQVSNGTSYDGVDKKWQDPVHQQFLASDFSMLNLRPHQDYEISDGSLAQGFDDSGNLRLYQVHNIIDVDGLRCFALSSYDNDKNKPAEIKVIFPGTSDISSGILDLQRYSPGYRSMAKYSESIIQAVSAISTQLNEQSNQSIKVSIEGHSLGGATAQHLYSHMAMAIATRESSQGSFLAKAGEKLDSYKKNDDVNLNRYITRAKKHVQKKYRDFQQRYSDDNKFSGLGYINVINLSSKNGAKGAKKNDYLASAAMAYLTSSKDGASPRVTSINNISRHTGDWVHKAGETQLLTRIPVVETNFLKVDSGKRKWNELHNDYAFPSKDENQSRKWVSLLSNQSNEGQEKIRAQGKRHTKIGRIFKPLQRLGSLIEKIPRLVRHMKRIRSVKKDLYPELSVKTFSQPDVKPQIIDAPTPTDGTQLDRSSDMSAAFQTASHTKDDQIEVFHSTQPSSENQSTIEPDVDATSSVGRAISPSQDKIQEPIGTSEGAKEVKEKSNRTSVKALTQFFESKSQENRKADRMNDGAELPKVSEKSHKKKSTP